LSAAAVLAVGLAWLAPAAAQSPSPPEKTAWRQVLKLDQRELDPSRSSSNPLKFPAGLKTHRFDFEYLPPQDKKHGRIYELMRDQEVLEKVQAFMAPLYLPSRVRLEIRGCDGRVNAQFWQNVITVCYEYFDWIWKNAPKKPKGGLTPGDAMVGPMVDVFLHEAGHAVLQLLDIPLLGSEEDAADYIATFLILQFSEADARRLIMGASIIFGSDALRDQERAPELLELAGRHSLPAQRYFNRLCMAYGKDPALYADAVGPGMLTRQRANHCAYEYAYNSDAFRRLVRPYIDPHLASEVLATKWFAFETPIAAVTPHPTANNKK
jgi:hypothetical protein